jgi:oxygen-independent coproporphyrinogen-3 oxidase
VTPGRRAGFRDAGVTRISFGVQSFRDEELKRLGRLHSADRAREAFAWARAAGFDSISLDLMMWLPAQTVGHWLESIASLAALGPDHASLYLLELYPNAPIREEMARGGWSLAPDEDAERMYLEGLAALDAQGYEQYEISNVARGGCRARHNLKYWTDGAWLGFGCGAHSTRGGVRWKNVAGSAEYVELVRHGRSPVAESHELSLEERVGDAMFTGLRLTEGVDAAAVSERYGVDVLERYGGALEPFLDEGLLGRTGSRLALTRRGMLLANEVMTIFV